MPRTKKTQPAITDANLGDVLAELRAIRSSLDAQDAAVFNRDRAAAYIGVSVATLDRLTSAGKLRAIRVSEGRVGWTRKALDAYLAAQEGGD